MINSKLSHSSFGVHPRFGRLMLRSLDLGAPELGAVIAALLSERSIIRYAADGTRVVQSADIMLRLRVLEDHALNPRGRFRTSAAVIAPVQPQLKGKRSTAEDDAGGVRY